MADFVEMPDTLWTVISRAKQGGRPALDTLLKKYRPPVLAFLRNAGLPAEEAEDLAQEVFIAIIEDDVLAKADRSRGRFRSLLLSIVRHMLADRRRHDATLKQGGDLKRVPFGPVDPAAADATDEAFDPLWIRNLVRIGMNRLRQDCEADGSPHFRALFLHTEEQLGYPEIAERLGVTTTDIKNYLHQARIRLKRHVLEEVRGYSSSRDEYEAEIAHLMKFLE